MSNALSDSKLSPIRPETDKSPGITYTSPTTPISYSEEAALKLREMDLESGFLGKFFGSPNSAPINIAGLIALLLIIGALGFTIWPPKDLNPLEMWKVIIPVITTILGYMIGKKTK